MSQKRERTHMLNAKYGRHGHEGQARHGHRGHANRPNPRQRIVQSSEQAIGATYDLDRNRTTTNDALRDALNGNLHSDASVKHVGKTTWAYAPDGKRVKVSVINVKQARKYCDMMELKNILDEIDKREGMPTSADIAMARPTARPQQAAASQTQLDDSMTSRPDMRNVKNINEVPITPQELVGEQILHEESTSAAMENLNRHIADLHEAIDNQAKERRKEASAKSDGTADRATKAASMSGGKHGGGGTRRARSGGRMSSGGGARNGGGGGGMRAANKNGNGKRGGTNREQLRRAKHQAFMKRRMDSIRKRIQRAKAAGNDRLANRLEASLKKMTERASKR